VPAQTAPVSRPSILFGSLLAVVLAVAAGCGSDDDAPDPDSAGKPSPDAVNTPSVEPTTVEPSSTTGTGPSFPPEGGQNCASPEQIIAAVKAANVADPSTPFTIGGSPVCEQDWVAATLTVPDSDPLQVVLRGKSGKLTLVSAGTFVCGDDKVRQQAPPRIKGVLGCD
jgi:hypothetical protein